MQIQNVMRGPTVGCHVNQPLRLLASVVAIGCAGPAAPAAGPDLGVVTTALAATSLADTGGCVDPAEYGAAPDDERDDQAAIQAAIDAVSGREGRESLPRTRALESIQSSHWLI